MIYGSYPLGATSPTIQYGEHTDSEFFDVDPYPSPTTWSWIRQPGLTGDPVEVWHIPGYQNPYDPAAEFAAKNPIPWSPAQVVEWNRRWNEGNKEHNRRMQFRAEYETIRKIPKWDGRGYVEDMTPALALDLTRDNFFSMWRPIPRAVSIQEGYLDNSGTFVPTSEAIDPGDFPYVIGSGKATTAQEYQVMKTDTTVPVLTTTTRPEDVISIWVDPEVENALPGMIPVTKVVTPNGAALVDSSGETIAASSSSSVLPLLMAGGAFLFLTRKKRR